MHKDTLESSRRHLRCFIPERYVAISPKVFFNALIIYGLIDLFSLERRLNGGPALRPRPNIENNVCGLLITLFVSIYYIMVILAAFPLAFLGLLFENTLGDPAVGELVSSEGKMATSQCKLYLALSSIEDAGIGMFTATDIDQDGEIGSPELVHQLFDLATHATPKLSDASTLSDCTWEADDYHGHFEARRVLSVIPGLGSAINSHPTLYNTLGGMPESTFSSTIVATGDGQRRALDRRTDAGAGAITYFEGLRSFATKDIKAGTELFSHYSDNFFADRQDVFGSVPLSVDFSSADSIISKFCGFIEGSDEEGRMFSDSFLQDFWKALTASFEPGDKDDPIAERFRAALPDTIEGVCSAAAIGAAAYSLPNLVRSTHWLRGNGKCVDNISPGISNIPQAGRGAFATRPMPRGDVVLPLPVIHIARSLLEIYDLRDDPNHRESGRLLKSKVPNTRQQIVNYSFGHPESSLLLFPYGPMSSYVNHASRDLNLLPNVELRWLGEGQHLSDFHHSEWMDMDVAEVLKLGRGGGLMLELVATRDIGHGEEVLLDYGDAWVSAWDDHVTSIRTKEKDGNYVYPHVLDSEESKIRTQEEQEERPYPENAMTACYYLLEQTLGSDNPVETRAISAGGVQFEEEGQVWSDGGDAYGSGSAYLQLCSVLERHDGIGKGGGGAHGGGATYTVRLFSAGQGDGADDDTVVLFDVPRRGIKFVDSPYRSDQHLRDAFRHEMGIPDDIFPDAWRDLRE